MDTDDPTPLAAAMAAHFSHPAYDPVDPRHLPILRAGFRAGWYAGLHDAADLATAATT